MTIIEIIFPVFIIVLAGYVAARQQLLSPRDVEGVSRFVFTVAIPVLLFNSLSHITLPDRFNWQFMLSYYLVVLLIYGLGFWVSKRWFGNTPQEQGVFGLGSAYSNLVLVGLPIITAGLGEEALLPLFMIISIHSALLFFIVMVLAERGNGDGRTPGQIALQTLRNLSRNPIVIGLFLGLAWNLTNLTFPTPIDEALTILSRATLPCALFVLGASLNSYKIAGHFGEAWTIIGLKMALQPFLVWVLAFVVFQIDPLWGAVAVMAAGMPVGINAYMMAQMYKVGIAAMSTAILMSTLLALVSQSLFLLLFT